MTKLTILVQYSKPLTQLLMSLPSGSWNRADSYTSAATLPQLNFETDSRAILARWTMDVIDTLVSVLEAKAKTLLRPKSAMATNLFMLNNLSEIEKRVRSDRMISTIVGSISAAEKEKEAAKRSSRVSSGSSASLGSFSMPKSFDKAKRAGLDGVCD